MKRLLFFLLFLSSSASAEKIPLAVYGVEPQGINPSTADIITDIVRSKLRGCGRFDLIEKSKMEEVLKLQGFQQSGCSEAECAAKVGRILNVKKIVVGGLGKLGTAYRLSLRVVDVETAVIEVEDEEKQVVKEEDLDQLVPPLVTRLCPRIRLTGATAPSDIGSLTVTSTPSGAKVFLDGELRGETPLGLTDLSAGGHQLVVTKDGYVDYVEAVAVTKDMKKTIAAALKALSGSLRVFSKPLGASILVDGEKRGVTPKEGLLITGLSVGEHQLRFAREGCEAYGSSALVEANGVKEVRASLVVVDVPGKKNSSQAFLMSACCPGLGQYYNGEPLKGLAMQAGFIGGVVMMVTSGIGDKKTYDPVRQDSVNKTNLTGYFPVGISLYTLSYFWSMIDAPISANRINKRKLKELREGHLLEFRNERYVLGLDLAPRKRGFEARASLYF
jgi:hypothetical protein